MFIFLRLRRIQGLAGAISTRRAPVVSFNVFWLASWLIGSSVIVAGASLGLSLGPVLSCASRSEENSFWDISNTSGLVAVQKYRVLETIFSSSLSTSSVRQRTQRGTIAIQFCRSGSLRNAFIADCCSDAFPTERRAFLR
jgi:hypothetical protein